jgi:hypothetical protein
VEERECDDHDTKEKERKVVGAKAAIEMDRKNAVMKGGIITYLHTCQEKMKFSRYM